MILNTKITLSEYLQMGGAQHKLVMSELSILQDVEVIEVKMVSGYDLYEVKFRTSIGHTGPLDLEPEHIFVQIDLMVNLTKEYL